MAARSLFIAAYDVSDPKRLRRVRMVLKEYSTGGQKSVFECFLTEPERRELLDRVREEVDEQADKFFLLRLDPRTEIRVFGKAVLPENPPYFTVG